MHTSLHTLHNSGGSLAICQTESPYTWPVDSQKKAQSILRHSASPTRLSSVSNVCVLGGYILPISYPSQDICHHNQIASGVMNCNSASSFIDA